MSLGEHTIAAEADEGDKVGGQTRGQLFPRFFIRWPCASKTADPVRLG
jgi:hypothetical protein